MPLIVGFEDPGPAGRSSRRLLILSRSGPELVFDGQNDVLVTAALHHKVPAGWEV